MMFASALQGLAILASIVPADARSGDPASPGLEQPQALVLTAERTEADRFAGRLRPEVRLRKLHLVRPDLIHYPIAHDVYC